MNNNVPIYRVEGHFDSAEMIFPNIEQIAPRLIKTLAAWGSKSSDNLL